MKLTIRDVSHLLGVSPKIIHQWIREEEFPSYRFKERYRFNQVDVLDWATIKKIPIRPKLGQASEDGLTISSGSLEKALEAGGIFTQVPSHDRALAVQSLVARLHLPDDIDPEFVIQILLARENLGIKAIGEGFAIPHARSPIVLNVDQPELTVFFFEHPLDLGANDVLFVHTLFTLISPTIHTHLFLLSRLGYALHNPIFRQMLKERASKEDLLAKIKKIDARLMALSGERKN